MAKAARIAGEPHPNQSLQSGCQEESAFDEAVLRYAPSGDVFGALIFYKGATSPPGVPTEAELDWARKAMDRHGR